ncbi:MAG: DUF5721 family protein [Lachnospiraceae bacterium]
MIALELTEVKECMAKLLLSDTFDPFLFIEGTITTFNTFTIDGYLHKEFFEAKPECNYSYWSELRGYCLSLIKGKRTPLNFKFVYGYASEQIAILLEKKELLFSLSDVQGLYLNIRYDGSSLQCITGTSMNTFTMDKSLEQEWDTMVKQFFSKKEIAYEEL